MGGMIALAPGTVFAGDYRIVRPLSAGGMGAVYVAQQISTARERALKIMLGELVGNADLERRFEQEAKIGAQIESEHVVEVVGAGIDAATRTPWLAMELLQGESLAELFARRGPLPPSLVLELFDQLAHAVGAAHDKQIVHRDLKPENVFLAKSKRAGSSFVLKVLDFGIAKLVNQVRTSATGAMGTPLWMAPEQAQAGMPVTPTADVWALGLIAFAALAGRLFWRSASAADSSAVMVLREMVMEPIPSASQRALELGCPRLPAGFDAWFARCVDRNPTARFPNAHAMQQALRPILLASAPSSVGAVEVVRPSAPSPSTAYVSGPLPLTNQVAFTNQVVAPRAPETQSVVGTHSTLAAPPAPQRGAAKFLVGGALACGAVAVIAFVVTRDPATKTQSHSGADDPDSPAKPATVQATGSSGSTPTTLASAAPSGPLSCREAASALHQDGSVHPAQGLPADLARVNEGSYLDACKVPSTASVQVCAYYDGAGPPKGVTIEVTPANEAERACVEAKIRAFETKENFEGMVTTTFTATGVKPSKPQAPAPRPTTPATNSERPHRSSPQPKVYATTI
ncbi:MAG: protein kinase [Polyangiaceae bacterium]